jgi:hypothetical protein
VYRRTVARTPARAFSRRPDIHIKGQEVTMRITRRIFALPVAAATLLVSAGGASAAPAEVIKEDVNLSFLTNSCNGEDVIFLDGTFRTVIKTGANGTIKQQAFIHLTGTGTSGTRYVTNQPLQATFNDSSDTGSSIAVLVSLGPQPNETTVFRWDSKSNLYSVNTVCHG